MKYRKCGLPFSVAVVKYDMVLFSSVAKSLERICRVSDWSLETLCTLHNRTTKEKFAELGRIVYEEILKSLEDRLQAEYSKINLLYDKYGIKHIGSRRKPEKITVELRHPHSRRVFNLLVGLDNMACQLEDLRFAGKISEIEYKKTLFDSKSLLKNAALSIRKLVGQAKEQAGIVSV